MVYADQLMSKAAQLCFDDTNKPEVPTAPSVITHIQTKTLYIHFLDISNER